MEAALDRGRFRRDRLRHAVGRGVSIIVLLGSFVGGRDSGRNFGAILRSNPNLNANPGPILLTLMTRRDGGKLSSRRHGHQGPMLVVGVFHGLEMLDARPV
jgi:hypothetical protein